MPDLNLTDDRGRDATVLAQSTSAPLRVRYLDPAGRTAQSRRVLRSTVEREADALLAAHDGDMEKVGEAILNGDPEIDFEAFGTMLEETVRVHLSADRTVAHRLTWQDVVYAADGSEKERRPHKLAEPNTALENLPLKWTGRLMKKAEAIRRFVFAGKMQVRHVNGLTYDFLFRMAKDLEEKQSLMMLAAGTKGNEPLVFRRGGTAWRAFLEGRTQGDSYALILHLTNQELKAPEPPKA